jgi:hypothetical protein
MREPRKARIPLFPLPGVVLLPETDLPLHIFEPRYRRMLADALDGERTLGVHTIDPAGGSDDQGRPLLLELGCAGRIVEHEPLEDGRSNILLRGLYRYRIDGEADPEGRPYRLADVTRLPVAPLPDGSPSRSVLEDAVVRLAVAVGRADASDLGADLSDEGFANEAGVRLGLDAEERYRLLRMDGLDERYTWLIGHVRSLQQRLDFLEPFRRPKTDGRWN